MKRRLRMILYALGVALVIFIGLAAYIRMAPDDPRVWHVDPQTAVRAGKPNDVVVAPEGGDLTSPIYEMTPAELMLRFRQVAMSRPRVTVLGEDGEVSTFVQRSRIMGYPDYISVKAVPAEGGAALWIYSRSRYGYGDMGVNRARIESWLKRL